MTCMVSSRPREGKRPIFKFFSCSSDCMIQKMYFPRLIRVCVGVIMLVACTYSRFPCFLLISRVGPFFQVSALDYHWLEDCANFTPLSVHYNPGSQSTFINTLLVISGNEKNKQLILITQHKLALTERNM
jgi:hypothetical protein